MYIRPIESKYLTNTHTEYTELKSIADLFGVDIRCFLVENEREKKKKMITLELNCASTMSSGFFNIC